MKEILGKYLKSRPLFLALIRAKEAWLFQKYLPLTPPILDLGCGDGFFAKIAFRKLNIGLDLKDSRIRESTKEAMYEKLMEYDGHKIPLRSGSVSTVVSNCVLEHIPNLEEVVEEVYRILKPGGLFITTVMAKPWEDNLMFGGWYKNWMRRKQVHFNLLNYWEWMKLWKNCGFEVREKIGYLSPTACKLIDFFHYFSLPIFIIYKLTGRWDWGWRWYPTERFAKIMNENVEADKSGAIFFELRKK